MNEFFLDFIYDDIILIQVDEVSKQVKIEVKYGYLVSLKAVIGPLMWDKQSFIKPLIVVLKVTCPEIL